LNVLDIATGSLRAIGIIGESKTPSAEQGANAVTRLNDLMTQWAEKGVNVGWDVKAATTDTVAVPLGLVHGIKAQLAELLASDYGVDIPPVVIREAAESRTLMQRQALQLQFTRPDLSAMPLSAGVYDINTGTYR
jgi:hypothetical protein